jgi:hypothetical protein
MFRSDRQCALKMSLSSEMQAQPGHTWEPQQFRDYALCNILINAVSALEGPGVDPVMPQQRVPHLDGWDPADNLASGYSHFVWKVV